jgi:hypothetical protein
VAASRLHTMLEKHIIQACGQHWRGREQYRDQEKKTHEKQTNDITKAVRKDWASPSGQG